MRLSVSIFCLLATLVSGTAFAADTPPAAGSPAGNATTAPAPPPAAPPDLYDIGKSLFDAYAPPEVKAQYEFVSREQWDGLVAGLQKAFETGSFAELAGYEQQVKDTIAALRLTPRQRGLCGLAGWPPG